MQSKQVATMRAVMTNNIDPHRRTMLILFAIPLLDKKKREFLERGADSKNICCGTVHIPAMLISMIFFVMSCRSSTSRYSFRSSAHQSQARRSLYGDWILRRHWTTNKGSILNTIVQCPLERRCTCSCQVKIVQTATQVITGMSIADIHTAQNHLEDKAKFLTRQQRSLVATAVKLAPMKSASQLLMRVQDSPTKKSTWRQRILFNA